MRISILLLCLLIGGCSTMPKVVNVPIPMETKTIQVEPEPHLPIYDLKKGDKPAVVDNAMIKSIRLLKSYITYLKKTYANCDEHT